MEDKHRPPELPHAELTNTIIGAFYDVANELGHGFSEQVLCRAMAIALKERGLAFEWRLTCQFTSTGS